MSDVLTSTSAPKTTAEASLPGAKANGTAEFVSISIFDAIGRIGNQQRPLYLPAIQRHFVWKQNQICKLFDSMMRGYPIGTFLFWEVEDNKRNDYAFYEFIRDFSRHADHCDNRTAPMALPPKVTGVLDGQQRLNSMYVALCGSYSEYLGGQGRHKANKINYPATRLYLNVLFVPDEEKDMQFEFDFWDENDGDPKLFNAKECWVPVHAIYHCQDDAEVNTYWEKLRANFPPTLVLNSEQTAGALSALKLLRAKVRDEKLITYFPVRGRDLTEALKIFIRANNGGTQVQNAEMIFSTIVAHWDVGRQKIEQLVAELNEVGHRFEFDVSDLMLACLALSGCPIHLKIESFKPAHVDKIKSVWENISASLREATHWFDEWGFSGNNKVNRNAVIAVALFANQGVAGKASKAEIHSFVIKSLLCEIYRRRESALNAIREYVQKHIPVGGPFSCDHFEQHFVLPSGDKMQVTTDLLDKLLQLPIHEARTFVVLSLLHPQHAIHEHAFHKDHIHPHAGFDDLSAFYLNEEGQARWHDWKNRLPNIQLLQGQVNSGKQAKPFIEWVAAQHPDQNVRGLYLAANDIPGDVSLSFRDFEVFYEARKHRLRERLAGLLKVDISNLQGPGTLGSKIELPMKI